MKPDATDILAVASLVTLAVGVALIYIPAAFIVVGLLGLMYAVIPDQGGPSS